MALRVLPVLVVVATLLGCAGGAEDRDRGDEPRPTPSPTVERSAGWTTIPVDGTVRTVTRGYQRVMLAGETDDGGPFIAGLVDDVVDLTMPQPDFPGPVRAVVENGASFAAVSAGLPVHWWLGAEYQDQPHTTLPRSRSGLPLAWVEPLMDGEEDVRAVALTRAGEDWRVHAFELWAEWAPLADRRPQLHLDPERAGEGLLAANGEASVLVAGDLAVRPEGPFRASAWVMGDRGFQQPWRRVPLRPAPDQLTDVSWWDLGFWLTGHRNGKPALYDVDKHWGRQVPAPDVALDAEQPTVLIANEPVAYDGRYVLAVQSAAGPEVWIQSARGWDSVPAPEGELQDAGMAGYQLYLVIDGELWWRTLDREQVHAEWLDPVPSPTATP